MLKVFDTKDLVPEAQRGTAHELKDGKWAADIPDVGDGGKSAIDKERDKARDAKEKLREAEQKIKDMERAQADRESGTSQEVLDRIKKAEAEAKKPLEEDNVKLKKANRDLKLKVAIDDRVRDYGIMKDREKAGRKMLAAMLDLSDTDDLVYKDDDGKITTQSEDAFAKQFKKDHPFLFSASTSQGGGAEGSDPGAGGAPDATAAAAAAGKAQGEAERKAKTEANALAFR